MYEVNTPTTIANVTDLRRSTSELFERVAKGASVIIQRNTDPVAVLVDPDDWEELQRARDQLLEVEQVLTAMLREQEIREGGRETLSHEEMLDRLGISEDELTSDDPDGG